MTGLIFALAVACSGAASEPIRTPTCAPTPTAVPQVATQTPSPVREWELQEISVDGSTVTVSLYVFAGIDVNVAVNGYSPSRVDAAIPILEFVFEDVAAGEHPVLISDTVGYSETVSVIVEAPQRVNGQLPGWLAKWVAELEAKNFEFPPQSITSYLSQGEIVYYVVRQCCDHFSDLLDADGNLIGHPGGGITGRGDGVTKFSPSGLEGEEIWLAP